NVVVLCFFFQAEDGIRDFHVTGVQTCALPIWRTLAAVPGFRLQTMDELHGPLNDGVLGTGDRGDAVADLQRQLRGLGATGGDGRLLDVSRRYDRDTREAVAHFQRQVGLAPADGLADER